MPLLAIITKNFHQSFIIKKTCRAGSPDPPYTRSLNIWPTLKNTEDAASRTSGAALATAWPLKWRIKVVHIVADDEHFLGFAPAPQLEQVSHARGLAHVRGGDIDTDIAEMHARILAATFRKSF